MNSAHTHTKTVNSVINTGKSYQYIDNGEPMRGGMKDAANTPLAETGMPLGKKIVMGGASRVSMSLSQNISKVGERASRCRHGLSVPGMVRTVRISVNDSPCMRTIVSNGDREPVRHHVMAIPRT